MASFCTRCGKQLGMLAGFNAGPRTRCKDCSRIVKTQLDDWRARFRGACADGLLTPSEWAALQQGLVFFKISQDEAAEYVQKDALSILERAFAFAKTDGQLEELEEHHIRWMIQELRLTHAAPHMLQELDYLATIRRIRAGKLPTIRPSIVLPSDELCYLETPASYRKVGRSKVTEIVGRLIVTNKKIIFAAQSGGGEIPLNKVLTVNWHPTGIFLELSRQANNGFYSVSNAQIVAEIILSATRLANRHALTSGNRDTRRIPRHIANQVWQRDGARCVECQATEYLEFDHIIPHSKGGATSVNNLQLLCRKCNLAKGARL